MGTSGKICLVIGVLFIMVAVICWTIYLNALASQLMSLACLSVGACFIGRAFKEDVPYPNPGNNYTLQMMIDLHAFGWIVVPCLIVLAWLALKILVTSIYMHRTSNLLLA